jgi:hypothetical protein
MQLTVHELQELRDTSKRRKDLGHASLVQPSSPETAEQDRNLYDREVALFEAAELRAEQILEQQSQQWHGWSCYFQANVWDEMKRPIDIEVHEDEVGDYLWDFKLRHIAAYKSASPSMRPEKGRD